MRARVRKDDQPVFRLTDIEVEEVSIVDRAANKRKFLVKKSGEETPTEEEKAVWTAAQINDLPDSAFLYVEPGGSKDEGGKTTPRSLRHFPVKGPDGSVDLPHLRNALSRIPQSSLSQDVKDRATAEAQRMLTAATKAEDALPDPLPGPKTEPALRLSPEAKAELAKRVAQATERLKALGAMIDGAETIAGLVEIPAELVTKVAELVSGISDGDIAKGEIVIKGLPQFSSSRLSQLQAARDSLDAIIAQVSPAPPAPPPLDPAEPVPAPAEDGGIEKKLEALETSVAKGLAQIATIVGKQSDALRDAVQKQATRIDLVERARPTSNAAPDDGEVPVKKSNEDDEPWPMDMADPDRFKATPAAAT